MSVTGRHRDWILGGILVLFSFGSLSAQPGQGKFVKLVVQTLDTSQKRAAIPNEGYLRLFVSSDLSAFARADTIPCDWWKPWCSPALKRVFDTDGRFSSLAVTLNIGSDAYPILLYDLDKRQSGNVIDFDVGKLRYLNGSLASLSVLDFKVQAVASSRSSDILFFFRALQTALPAVDILLPGVGTTITHLTETMTTAISAANGGTAPWDASLAIGLHPGASPNGVVLPLNGSTIALVFVPNSADDGAQVLPGGVSVCASNASALCVRGMRFVEYPYLLLRGSLEPARSMRDFVPGAYSCTMSESDLVGATNAINQGGFTTSQRILEAYFVRAIREAATIQNGKADTADSAAEVAHFMVRTTPDSTVPAWPGYGQGMWAGIKTCLKQAVEGRPVNVQYLIGSFEQAFRAAADWPTLLQRGLSEAQRKDSLESYLALVTAPLITSSLAHGVDVDELIHARDDLSARLLPYYVAMAASAETTADPKAAYLQLAAQPATACDSCRKLLDVAQGRARTRVQVATARTQDSATKALADSLGTLRASRDSLAATVAALSRQLSPQTGLHSVIEPPKPDTTRASAVVHEAVARLDSAATALKARPSTSAATAAANTSVAGLLQSIRQASADVRRAVAGTETAPTHSMQE